MKGWGATYMSGLNEGADSDPSSVSRWIDLTRNGDSNALQKIWERYYRSLTDYAKTQLPDFVRQMRDEEDIAHSTLQSMLIGFREGNYPEIQNRQDLWKILTLIAAREAKKHIRYENQDVRDKKRNQDADCLVDQNGTEGLDPALLAEFTDVCRIVFEALPNDLTRQVASLRLEGYRFNEIADKLKIARRTVERKLNLIRLTWLTIVENH